MDDGRQAPAREWWRVGAVAAAVLALVLGLVGLHRHVPTMAAQDVLYAVLQLFVLEERGLGAPPYNLLLEVARFLAPATTVYAVFEAMRALLSEEIRRKRIANRRGHAIVVGDDAAALTLARVLGASTRKTRVVLVGLPISRTERIDVVLGDPREAATLRAAGVRGAAVVYACAGADDINPAVALLAAQLATGRAQRFRAFARISDDELVDTLRLRQLTDGRPSRTAIDFFTMEDTAARAVLAVTTAGAALGPVAIVGGGPFAVALLRALVRGPGADGSRRRVSVYAEDPAAIAGIAQRLGAAERGVVVEPTDLGDPIVEPCERILVSLPEDEATVKYALRLLRVPDRQVVACLRRATPFAAALDGTEGLQVIGVLDQAYQPEWIEADAMIGRLARTIHQHYVDQRRAAGDSEQTNASIRDWEDLPLHLQEANYAQAEHIPVKLRQLGAVLSASRPALPFAFRTGEVERLAKLEHVRWMNERRAAGFEWGPSRTETRHPDLVDWSNLPADSRHKDIQAVEFLPELLHSAGLFITRTSGTDTTDAARDRARRTPATPRR